MTAERLSVRQTAIRLGVSRQAVQHWRTGAALPCPVSAAALRELLVGLDVPERLRGRPRKGSQ